MNTIADAQRKFQVVLPRLTTELELLYADEQYRNTSVSKLVSLLRENEVHEDVFEESYKLFCLILTLPSTSASVERSFSCLRRIKTDLQATMCQRRLSALANISIQKEVIEKISKKQPFHEDVVEKYAALKDRRINLIYKN
ncbi:hypothetical protein ANN_10789, partial [Periplaneta americana]